MRLLCIHRAWHLTNSTLLRAIRDVFAVVARASAAAHLYDELSRQCDAALAEKGLRRADVTRAAYDALTIDHRFSNGGPLPARLAPKCIGDEARAQNKSWPGCKSLLVALAILGADVSVAHAQSGDTVDALNAKVGELYKVGKYAEALPIAQRAVALAEGQFGPDDSAVAQALEKLANLYYRQGRNSDAEPAYERSLAILERAFGPDHLDVATTLNSFAVLPHSQGRYTDAEPMLKRALLVRESALGPDHPYVGTTLNNLAVLYSVQGRYAEAETRL